MNPEPLKPFHSYVSDCFSKSDYKLNKVKVMGAKSLEELRTLRAQLAESIAEAEGMDLSIKDLAIVADGKRKLAALDKHIGAQERFKRWGI